MKINILFYPILSYITAEVRISCVSVYSVVSDLFSLAKFPNRLLFNVSVHEIPLEFCAGRLVTADLAVYGAADEEVIPVHTVVSLDQTEIIVRQTVTKTLLPYILELHIQVTCPDTISVRQMRIAVTVERYTGSNFSNVYTMTVQFQTIISNYYPDR